jgi:hypothetical protein
MPDDAPWVDPVTVPDDLRELQPDIEAYHREQRLARRRRRLQRLTAGRTWHSLAVPGGLAVFFAILAGGLTALLLLGQPPARPAPAPAPVRTSAPGSLLADAVLTHDGQAVPARSLRPALFALVPLACRCADVLDSLAGQADEAGLPLVVVAPADTDAEVAALPGQLHGGRVEPVYDPTGSLAHAYAAAGVTVLVVAPDATVTYVQTRVGATTRLELPLERLTTGTGSSH